MRRRKVIFCGLLAVAVMAVAWSTIWPREPAYQGRSLGEWMELSYPGADGAGAEAIRKIGTKGIPYLLAWSKYETPKWKRKVWNMSSRLPVVVSQRLTSWLARVDRRKGNAVWAFSVLGPDAAPAIPKLIQWLDNP